MKLTEQQIADYHKNGYLVVNDVFSKEEMQIMLEHIEEIKKTYSFVSKNHATSYGQKNLFGPHKSEQLYRHLSYSERVVKPSMQLLDGDDVYIHQSRLAAKVAMVGEGYSWHQDFAYFHFADDVPLPKILSCCIFLNETNEFNGPLMVAPGSHKEALIVGDDGKQFIKKRNLFGRLKAKYNNERNNYLQRMDRGILKSLLEKYGITSIKGAAGSVLYFHGHLLHGSAQNISHLDRHCYFISYNSVHNAPHTSFIPRHELMSESSNFQKITPLADEELSKFFSK